MTTFAIDFVADIEQDDDTRIVRIRGRVRTASVALLTEPLYTDIVRPGSERAVLADVPLAASSIEYMFSDRGFDQIDSDLTDLRREFHQHQHGQPQ